MIQLSLFPTRGYGIILPGNALAFDHGEGRPYFAQSRASARRTVRKLPRWMSGAYVVPIEVHDEATWVT
jgi:hypothetical protein